MKKILVYCDTNWSIGRIYKDLNKYLENDFLITYYDWANYSPSFILQLLDNFDIFITNLVNIKYFINVPPEKLKKMIFSCHGFVEFNPLKNFNFPKEPIYSIVSKSIETFFPENMRKNLYHTYNGVELSQFNYIKRNNKITNVGWCGAPHVDWKRSNWCETICEKTNLKLLIASKLTYDELKEWYNNIDILLINSGPNYWQETGPLPAFEAIASGVLVIGTSVGNFAEIPGPKYSSIEEAINIIEELKNNPDKVNKISEEQYECVKKNWSYDILHKQWANMYNNVNI